MVIIDSVKFDQLNFVFVRSVHRIDLMRGFVGLCFMITLILEKV